MKHTFFLACLSLFVLHAAAESTIRVTDPWVREPNPAQSVAAGFMAIDNPGDEAIVIAGASSPAAEVVEIHEMKTVEGVMKMRMMDSLEIPARSSVKLEPGGLHLMMIRLTRELSDGDTVEIELKLESGESIQVSAPVRKMEMHH